MADRSVQINGEVKSLEHHHSEFAAKVYRDWIKSNDPDGIIVCKDTENVSISANANLLHTVTSSNVIFSWNFKITTCGKKLHRVVLTMDQNRNNFILASVCKNNVEIGTTINTQEWCNTNLKIDKSNGTKRMQYNLKISFTANKYGTYRQTIMFYFGEYPVILRRICMDCLPIKDYLRISNAAEYQLSQTPKMWIDESMHVKKFHSPFVTPKDPNEAKLSMVYPYPDKSNFLLTQETLTDDCLTPKNYRGRFHELISVEELARHEQIARYNKVCAMQLFSHYILSSTGDASTMAKYAPPGELFAQLSLSRSISEDTKSGRLFLRGCNSVIFMQLSNNLEPGPLFEAHIEDKCINNIYIRLSKECVDKLNLIANINMTVQVQFVLNRLPFCEWHRAVDCLPDVNLVFLQKVHRELKKEIVLELLNTEVSTFNKNRAWLTSLSQLNEDQKRALTIMTASTSISLPPILLLGPFGTGKTFTIAQALRILLTQNPKHKILLCTHSNSAADLYVKEFFDVWYKLERTPSLKPVRVYYKGRARNTVHPVVQEYSLMKENGTFRDPVEEDLRDCGLIVTTLATSSSLTCLNLSLTHIVIDEAAQALECEVLVPLTLATPDTRLILAGDHMQLAPEIYSDLANERGLGISLLERIYGLYPAKHPCKIHLCQNYRAHADIMKFTSEMFYDGMVQPGGNQLCRHPVLKPLMFYAVQGEEIQGLHSTGYAHPSEALELANRVSELRNTWPVTLWGPYGEGSIGVLSYYADQVQRIRMELRKRNLFDVSVERVLNVQGKQFTAVFISTVRTRGCCRYSAERNVKDYGFLTNPRLLNTAITRAKCLVAVVGDPIALLTIGSCRKLWQKYIEVADLRGTDRETLKYHLSMVPELPLASPLNPLAQEFVPRNLRSSCLVEYVPVPMMYSVIHYPPTFWTLR